MRMLKLSSWSVALPAMLLLSGCGGAGVQNGDGRGEGNIPIGRLSNMQGPVAVSEANATQIVSAAVNGQGTIYNSTLPVGPTTVTIVTPACTDTLPVVLGLQQNYVVDGFYNMPVKGATVTGLTITLSNGPTLAVGSTSQVTVAVTGSNLSGLRPNVWVNNGLGSFDANHNFIAGTAGSGSIGAELLGVTVTLPITVH